MAEVVKKFFIASMFMWIAPLAILFGFNHNLLPGVVAVSLKSLSSALGRLLAGVDCFTVKLIGVLAVIASESLMLELQIAVFFNFLFVSLCGDLVKRNVVAVKIGDG
ncbi:hypothetical protein Patl1_12164 [Pistacia atlantica]|uniref:Uncharacterized protein n=1 Tax=Pistacia atlantica TaxID=434234 RepID=A0ACC1A0I3_9ROSI|nr:hypothetical protein Patl1_12164 [Pistacia atlantica]